MLSSPIANERAACCHVRFKINLSLHPLKTVLKLHLNSQLHRSPILRSIAHTLNIYIGPRCGAASSLPAVYLTRTHTATDYISEFLRALVNGETQTDDAPIMKKLSGILPPEVSVEEHREHLSEKYGL